MMQEDTLSPPTQCGPAETRGLEKWLSIHGGRITLLKSVLSAMPLHYMQVIQLPKWLINQLEAICRRFLWRGKNKCLGGYCLVNWRKCCLPKANGGLGILNLAVQNHSLLIKWIWKLASQPDSSWTTFIRTLHGSTDLHTLEQLQEISHGFKDILALAPFFKMSTMATQQGSTPTWRWHSSGTYSAANAYAVLVDPGSKGAYHQLLWKVKAPLKVRIFLWLLLHIRVLRQRNLQLRSWPTDYICRCCPDGTLEDVEHLFIHSDLATQSWIGIQLRLELPALTLTVDIPSMWLRNRATIGSNWDII